DGVGAADLGGVHAEAESGQRGGTPVVHDLDGGGAALPGRREGEDAVAVEGGGGHPVEAGAGHGQLHGVEQFLGADVGAGGQVQVVGGAVERELEGVVGPGDLDAGQGALRGLDGGGRGLGDGHSVAAQGQVGPAGDRADAHGPHAGGHQEVAGGGHDGRG